ncbi:MAG: OmpA family protein [Chitinophagaceae bacterium]|nr:OmpA family protein [Chitinophagaceae bacterium]
MKPKLFLLILMITISCGGFSQVITSVDSILAKYDTLSVIPDTLINKIDTSKKTLIGQVKTSDTVTTKSNSAVQEEKKTEIKKLDKRWFISPFLKLQAQEFGMLEQQRMRGESNSYLLPFVNKSNRSAAASVYKNFTKNISMSLDLGVSKGRLTSKDKMISTATTQTYFLSNATVYYHLLGGQYKLQPFISGGINNLMKKESYTSAPVGAGVKFTGKKLMVEAQGAYGYALSKNIANTLMYHVGIYIPFKTKKQKKEEAQAKKDSAGVNITTIINNYYLLNNSDSLRKAQEDSIKKAQSAKAQDEDPIDELDADDPMRLPGARKFTVYFYYDQYSLTSSAFATIDRVIAKLKENKNLYVHLKGHTDMTGSENYNSPLSMKRAKMVFEYMNSRGVPASRMVLSSYGKKSPAIKNEDPNTAWMNRRCEMVLFEKKH